jgi:glutamyl-tRNA reductase
MENNTQSKHHYFISVGLSYKSRCRNEVKFSLDTLAKRLLEQAKKRGSSLIVTSTCNRTEIWLCRTPFQLIKLICEIVMVALKSFKSRFCL